MGDVLVGMDGLRGWVVGVLHVLDGFELMNTI